MNISDALPSCHAAPRTPMWLASLLLAAALAGCGGDGEETALAPPPPPAGPPPSAERNLEPRTADPQVDTALEPHVAINPSAGVAAANKLFVFLPGTEGTPDMYRLILRSGASRGFHALGLNYPNPFPVGVLCANSPDKDCFWNVRREIITGADLSPLVDVDGPNSIVTRLTKALAYMQATYPTEGWGQYLANGSVDWAKVTVAGHSQGGGHAGVMAKLYSMNRTVYFASPADWSNTFNSAADWTGKTSVTPTQKQFGFTHLQDTLVPYGELTAIWQTMGLSAFGAAVSVDTSVAPYGSSHTLTTQAAPNTAGISVSPSHGATVLDAATPMNNGAPLFDPVWAYLCFQ